MKTASLLLLVLTMGSILAIGCGDEEPATSPAIPSPQPTAESTQVPTPSSSPTPPPAATPTPEPSPTPGAVNETGFPLTLPAGFRISLFTPEAIGPIRFMAFSPDGTLFVTLPSTAGLYTGRRAGGTVFALPDRDRDGTADEVLPVIAGLNEVSIVKSQVMRKIVQVRVTGDCVLFGQVQPAARRNHGVQAGWVRRARFRRGTPQRRRLCFPSWDGGDVGYRKRSRSPGSGPPSG